MRTGALHLAAGQHPPHCSSCSSLAAIADPQLIFHMFHYRGQQHRPIPEPPRRPTVQGNAHHLRQGTSHAWDKMAVLPHSDPVPARVASSHWRRQAAPGMRSPPGSCSSVDSERALVSRAAASSRRCTEKNRTKHRTNGASSRRRPQSAQEATPAATAEEVHVEQQTAVDQPTTQSERRQSAVDSVQSERWQSAVDSVQSGRRQSAADLQIERRATVVAAAAPPSRRPAVTVSYKVVNTFQPMLRKGKEVIPKLNPAPTGIEPYREIYVCADGEKRRSGSRSPKHFSGSLGLQ